MFDIGLFMAFAQQHPELIAQAAGRAADMARPGIVQKEQMRQSFADLASGILKCYHKSASFRNAQLLQKPWPGAVQFGAEGSAVVGIGYSGLTGATYGMVVAFMWKGESIRAHVLQDSALIPRNPACSLVGWS